MKKRNFFLAFLGLWLGLQAIATTAIQAVGTEPNLNAQSAIAVDAARTNFISEGSNGTIRSREFDQAA